MTQNPKIKLVIVDDHTLFREGIKKILSLEEDIEIIGEAFDGEDVISLLGRCEPDIMLLDVKMERINGLQILPQIVEQFPRLRVMILTAQISLGESVKAIRDGARGIILKHAASEFLIKGVRRLRLWSRSPANLGSIAVPRRVVRSCLSVRLKLSYSLRQATVTKKLPPSFSSASRQ